VDFNQKIIDLKGTFEHVWDNELGEAYLFTNCELYKQYYNAFILLFFLSLTSFKCIITYPEKAS